MEQGRRTGGRKQGPIILFNESTRFRIPHRRPTGTAVTAKANTKNPTPKFYTPDVEGTKAEADAKRARRAKIVFIILDIS